MQRTDRHSKHAIRTPFVEIRYVQSFRKYLSSKELSFRKQDMQATCSRVQLYNHDIKVNLSTGSLSPFRSFPSQARHRVPVKAVVRPSNDAPKPMPDLPRMPALLKELVSPYSFKARDYNRLFKGKSPRRNQTVSRATSLGRRVIPVYRLNS